jgi:glycine/D-amino acid oxidase-like deaminating enzyme
MPSCPPAKTEVLIVGGGAAGWLTAAVLSATHNLDDGVLAAQPRVQVTVLESPDVPTIGVGEGTWPSMRQTLKLIGLSETEFFRCCDVSAKQGSLFVDWLKPGSRYLHPFTLPAGWPEFNLAACWLPFAADIAFADAATTQYQLSLAGFAPRLPQAADYQPVLNYGYHLNAGKFTALLQQHCLNKLGVFYIPAHLQEVVLRDDGAIDKLLASPAGSTELCAYQADLYVDCTGMQSLLLGQALKTPLLSVKSVLFNDRALAVQVPYPQADTPIASNTISTAQDSGWIWDIGLPTRRGVGFVYASDYCSDDEADACLRSYLTQTAGAALAAAAEPRKLQFQPGYRQGCWQQNCVAVGMAAGFIEPLEASALALVEWTAKTLAAALPLEPALYSLAAAKMNRTFSRHWQQIIEFLKLHYVLSERDSAYWRAHREVASIPQTLQDQLALWQQQVPQPLDFAYQDLLFPAASYQYVMYGMGALTQTLPAKPSQQARARALFAQNYQDLIKLQHVLPNNRQLLQQLALKN